MPVGLTVPTPTPWRVGADIRGKEITIHILAKEASAEGVAAWAYVSTLNGTSPEIKAANAALIVNAVNAHEALVASLDEIVTEWGSPNTPKWHRAKAALKLARGEA